MAKPAPTVFKAASKVAAVLDGSFNVQEAIEALLIRIKKMPEDLALPQDMLAAKYEIDALGKVIEEADKELKAKIASHINNGGKVEKGEYAVKVTSQTRTTVGWQEVAVDLAMAAALKTGAKFSKETFIEKTKSAIGKETTSDVVKVIKSDG